MSIFKYYRITLLFTFLLNINLYAQKTEFTNNKSVMKQTELVQKFYDSLAKGDFETVNILLTDDLIWHQPGKGVLSGSYKGKDVVFAHLSRMAELSKGSFGIEVDFISENRNLVAVSVHFSLSVDGNSMTMKGIDVFRIEENKICEVWLFSERIEEEDAFWTNLAK